MVNERLSWDSYFMRISQTVSERSVCWSRKLGAVVVRDNTILVTGYNGPHRGSNLCDIACIWPREKRAYRTDLGGCPAAHAEANCVHQAARVGVSLKGGTLYVTSCVPCKACMGAIINSGITAIVCFASMEKNDGLYYDELSRVYVEGGDIEVFVYDALRDQKIQIK